MGAGADPGDAHHGDGGEAEGQYETRPATSRGHSHEQDADEHGCSGHVAAREAGRDEEVRDVGTGGSRPADERFDCRRRGLGGDRDDQHFGTPAQARPRRDERQRSDHGSPDRQAADEVDGVERAVEQARARRGGRRIDRVEDHRAASHGDGEPDQHRQGEDPRQHGLIERGAPQHAVGSGALASIQRSAKARALDASNVSRRSARSQATIA